MGLTEQKNVLNDIISDVRHVKSALETIKNDQAIQNKAAEDMMIAIKENAENAESNYKLVFAMFFFGCNRYCCACGYIKILLAVGKYAL